jgi:acetoin utilization deacetylase AcuC-like enzyme
MNLPVFFDERMVSMPDSFSPSARKPAQVVAHLEAIGLPLDLHRPTPVSIDELSRVHDRHFVEGVLAGRIANGFGDRSPEVAASLPWTSGAMLSAARHAIAHRTMVLAPCSGFHHAGVRRASGFCTFNGLAVAAAALHDDGARTIGILDADYHYGDGTQEILADRGWVRHVTIGARYTRPEHARPFLEALPQMVESMRGCDVLLYQAGADAHVDDPLGGFLTTEELALRDAIVFRTARALGLPVAWNLAGGYRRDANGGISEVLLVHENTARACLESVRATRAQSRPTEA